MADTTATVPGGDGPAPPKDAYACKSEHYFAVVDSLMPEDTGVVCGVAQPSAISSNTPLAAHFEC